MGLGRKLLLGSVLAAVAGALALYFMRAGPMSLQVPVTVSNNPDHPLSAFYVANGGPDSAVVGHETPDADEPELQAGEILVQVSSDCAATNTLIVAHR
jgi:hypothetical protein